MSRDIELVARTTETRETKEVYKVFTLKDIKSVFNQTISDINESLLYAANLGDYQKAELYRYQIVLLESAFDYACHCLIKYGFIKIYRGEWSETPRYNNFQVKFYQLKGAIVDGIDENWILKMVDDKIATQTFLGFNDLKDGFNYIYDGLIKTVSKNIYNKDDSNSINEFRDEIEYVYKRRNMIAHQNDRQHISGDKNPISQEEVKKCINSITKILNAVISFIESLPNNPS